jgi:hypothetical protein
MTHPKRDIECPIFQHVREAIMQCNTGPAGKWGGRKLAHVEIDVKSFWNI